MNGGAQRIARLVFTLGALGEIGVGALVLLAPSVGHFLIGAPLDATGMLVTRMLGGAMVALGITWWLARSNAGAMARCAAGFILYNVAIAALFAFAALAAAEPALPWLVCVAHTVLGAAFIAGSLVPGAAKHT